MVKLLVRTREGPTVEIEAREGKNLMTALVTGRIQGIEGACGGSMVCGTCHAYIEEPLLSKLPPKSSSEEGILAEAIHVLPNSRVTCNVIVTADFEGGLVVIPPAQF